ncbi:MAG: methyltransferase domain-containing protein [Streptosporangiales bacterium]|nr:methyltransferase domain-containing protein [Streptosporangiales bacterium]
MARRIPERLHWTIERLAVEPADRLLEIGCGRGIAVPLVCNRLDIGTLLAVDRSPVAIDAAIEANEPHIAGGKASFRTCAFADLDPAGLCVDKIFAVNVNLFWTGDAAAELALTRTLLAPAGALYLCYEPPTAAKADEVARTVTGVLAAQGFTAEPTTATTKKGQTLLCLTATATRPHS